MWIIIKPNGKKFSSSTSTETIRWRGREREREKIKIGWRELPESFLHHSKSSVTCEWTENNLLSRFYQSIKRGKLITLHVKKIRISCPWEIDCEVRWNERLLFATMNERLWKWKNTRETLSKIRLFRGVARYCSSLSFVPVTVHNFKAKPGNLVENIIETRRLCEKMRLFWCMSGNCPSLYDYK